METTILPWVYNGLYWDTGKEGGHHYLESRATVWCDAVSSSCQYPRTEYYITATSDLCLPLSSAALAAFFRLSSGSYPEPSTPKNMTSSLLETPQKGTPDPKPYKSLSL